VNPQFPLYIVSKGRWESRLTSITLEEMRVPYFIVVEESEYNNYTQVIDKKKVLILDPDFKKKYDTFSEDPNLGGGKGTGSGPARNFAWEDSIKRGYEYHWVMDDNIRYFFRYNKNLKVPVSDGSIFRAMEDFVLRYINVAMAGPNYFMFASRKNKGPPVTFNTRIYSCNLIKNSIPFRWRGRFNEDTDLSLRILKNKYCTVLFNAFLQGKSTTLKMKGGNTDTIYKDGTLPKSRMLQLMHPDVTKVVYKFNRWHHSVDYSPFKTNKLVKKEGIVITGETNNYGMTLKKGINGSR
jgi:hypothetical protein